MKKRYTEEQIIKAIKDHEAGIKAEYLCRRLGISTGTFYSGVAKMPEWKLVKPSL